MIGRIYEAPQVEILEVDVEKGYLGSIPPYVEDEFEWD